jgi:hypothetical protein
MLKVKDEYNNIIPNLMKNELGGIVVSKTAEYDQFMAQKNNANKLNSLENEINNIKEDMSEIKHLLITLLNK